MLTLALVGRPNVGKSTLFNRLTGSRDALVADVPGLTRDRQYGRATLNDMSLTLIDTGGLFGAEGDISGLMAQQVDEALDEADAVLFLVDARDGCLPDDEQIALDLRRRGARVLLVVNKIDGQHAAQVSADFAALGFPLAAEISASHGRGLKQLGDLIGEIAVELRVGVLEEDAAPSAALPGVRVAIVGRPNVGKSTLVNRLVGEARQVVFDEPGTTRDAVEVPFGVDDRDYVLIDTAGVRRKGKVREVVEKFSVVKTLQALGAAQVAILVIDGSEGLVDQDLHMLSFALEAGTGVIVAVNKWDGLSADQRRQTQDALDRKLAFAPWLPQRMISALHGTGVGHLLDDVDAVYAAGEFDVSTSLLTRILEEAVAQHPPPAPRGRLIKLRFAHPHGTHPPSIRIHGNQTASLPASYVRYLENVYRDTLKLIGTPVKLEFRSSDNPFAGKGNVLNARQKKSRSRMIKNTREARKRRSRQRRES
ncbi:MAG: ribosome biogenesis GTPase Der [Pseudomonadota bacterium]